MPVFTSDGLNHYFYALSAHFGQWVAQAGNRLPVWSDLRADHRLLPAQPYRHRCRPLARGSQGGDLQQPVSIICLTGECQGGLHAKTGGQHQCRSKQSSNH